MLNPFKALLPAVAALSLIAPARAEGPTWFADFDLAKAEAEKTGKDLLVDFTGSDWCVWCKKLHSEVFDFEAFQKGVENDFVLVALDFPRDEAIKAAVPNPERNDELMNQHGVRGFPTILLMNSKGEVYGRTGYRPDGPEAYVAHLGELRTSGKRALAEIGTLLEAFNGSEGEAKLAAWDKLADLADTLDSESPFGARLVEPLKVALTVDPKNEQGRKLRAVKSLLTLGLADEAIYATVPELDPTNEHGLAEQALEARFGAVNSDSTARMALASLIAFDSTSKFKDTERATRMYANVAMWLSGPLADPEGAKPWAQKALDLKPADANMVAALEKIAAGS